MTASRNSFTFKEGLTMMAAKAVGIDPDLAVAAGEGAKATINAIRNAAKARTPKDRANYIRDAQRELKSISPAKHPKLVNAIQVRLLAVQGRGGDTEIAHVTPGEMVIPRALQTPAVMQALALEAARKGINPTAFRVGSPKASINPRTGAEEFFLEKIGEWFRSLNAKPQLEHDGSEVQSDSREPPYLAVDANLPSFGKDMPPIEIARSIQTWGRIDPTNTQDRASFARGFLENTGLSDDALHALRQGVIPGAEGVAKSAVEIGASGAQHQYDSTGEVDRTFFFPGVDGKVYRKSPEVRESSPLGNAVRFFDNQLSSLDDPGGKLKEIKPKGPRPYTPRPIFSNRILP